MVLSSLLKDLHSFQDGFPPTTSISGMKLEPSHCYNLKLESYTIWMDPARSYTKTSLHRGYTLKGQIFVLSPAKVGIPLMGASKI